MDVLVDLDVGDHRFGIDPGAPAVSWPGRSPAARRFGSGASRRTPASPRTSTGSRPAKAVSRTAMVQAVETRDLLSKDGHDAAFLSGGSTGTYNIDSELPGGIELQVGSYVFMDVGYRAIGGKSGRRGLHRLPAQPDRPDHGRQHHARRPRLGRRRDQVVRDRLRRHARGQGLGRPEATSSSATSSGC